VTDGSTKQKTELIVKKIDRMNTICLSGKVPSVVSHVVDLLTSHKQVVVVSPRIEIMEMTDRALTALHPDLTTSFFTGQTSPEKRDEIISRFLSEEGERVLFLSMKAGGEGLNLVPGPTACIHIAFWWTSAAHEQASGRIHRRGQISPVEIRYLYTEGTIEQSILDLGDDKAYAAAIVTDTDMSLRDFRQATRRVANANKDNEKWKRTNKLLDSLEALPEEGNEPREASGGEQAAKRVKLME
jgi:SNF2 family DNA or RNA helicase